MANIPERQNTTIAAIYQHYEDSRDSEFRPHLGASIIGTECHRALWLKYRWTFRVSHKGRLLRLFETGQMAEARFVQNLRDVGVEIFDIDPDTNQQFQVWDLGGHFGGSMDGVGVGFIESKKAPHVIEMKTHGDSSFKQLVKKGVKESKPQHYSQMVAYMALRGEKRAYYIAVNKNTDELYGERIINNPTHWNYLRLKAENVITSDRPLERINNKADSYACRFCDEKPVCHGKTIPEINCRTCVYSTPVMEFKTGLWLCELKTLSIDTAMQKVGCESHLLNPYIIDHWAEPIESFGNEIRYLIKETGEQFYNGPGNPSKDLAAKFGGLK